MDRRITSRVVDEETWFLTREAYLAWDKLNEALLALGSRIANFPSIISELAACYFLNYEHMLVGNSGDAYDRANNHIIEIKATSNYNIDLSSFSPSEWYDNLIFVRHSIENKTLSLYNLRMSRDDIDLIPVNSYQTYADHRLANRRPRFSIIRQIIERYNLKPDVIIDMETGQVFIE